MIDQLVKRLAFVNDFFVKFPWISKRRKKAKKITFFFSITSLVVVNIKSANYGLEKKIQIKNTEVLCKVQFSPLQQSLEEVGFNLLKEQGSPLVKQPQDH